MATVRINIDKHEEQSDKAWNDMTLMEKWRHRYNDKERSIQSANAAKQYARLTFAFQSTTQLYVFLCVIIPRLFDDFDEWTRYWLKVFTVFVCVEWFMNYFCTIFYSTNITKTRDNPTIETKERWNNPPEYFESFLADGARSNGHAPQFTNCPRDDGGISWNYCQDCEIHIPPRAYHCNICRTCILKRDHHCYFVGTCIGFRNQRYFYVLSFYSIIIGAVAFYFTWIYLETFYWPVAYSWTNYLPPIAVYRWILGSEDLNFHLVLLIVHLYIEFICGLLGIVYCTAQTVLVFKGITMFEFAKQVKVKCNNSVNQNFRSVFGDFWALNFIFPMTILFKQRDDGYKWDGVKINHNSNYKKKVYNY
ncbi:ZDHHC [Mytilus edulis]|uniref:Palmitoyltransferase n=1 Tax=Mytilus edulis TaxID=6550 RepID=A0A8S3QX83_MYTED|nr:ZDHHC [Mytilus edulis]